MDRHDARSSIPVSHDASCDWRLDKRIDELCDSFESQLRQGQRPRISLLLSELGDCGQDRLLHELLMLEWDDCDSRQVSWSVEDYVQELPEWEQAIRNALHDYRQRTSAPDPETTEHFIPRHQSSDELGVSALKPGTEITQYVLMDEIGAGGVGIVFRARQLGTDRLVALKFLNLPRCAANSRRQLHQRFLREPKAVARLDHDNIVPLYEATEFKGLPFFSMKLIDGPSLRDLVKDGPLDCHKAASHVRDVALAIHHAHQQNVLHRDIKPGNILIDGDDRPYVTDFGMAKLLLQDTELTDGGTGLGTIAYVSPEQAEDASTADRRSDVYGLGATLYCLLTGRPPFQAASQHETLRQVREVEPVPPGQLNDAIDRDLETICLKCLAKEPGRRYQTAEDFAADVTRFLTNEPISARRLGYVARLSKWRRRNPYIAALTASLALALVLGSAISLFFGIRANWARDEAEIASQATAKALSQSEALRRKVTLALSDTQVQLGLNAGSPNPEEACLWFASATQSAKSDAKRYSTNLRRLSSWDQITTKPLSAFSISPRRPQYLFLHPGANHAIVRDRYGRSDVWDLVNESIMLDSSKNELTGTAACFNLRGDKLALSTQDGRSFKLLHFPSLSTIWERNVEEPISKVVFSRRSTQLGIAYKSAVELLSATSGETIATLPLRHTYALSFSYDSRQLIVGHRDGDKSRNGSISVFSLPDLEKTRKDGQFLPSQASIPHRLDPARKPLDRMGPLFVGKKSEFLFVHDKANQVEKRDATGRTPPSSFSIPEHLRFASHGIRELRSAPGQSLAALIGFRRAIAFDAHQLKHNVVVEHQDGLSAVAIDHAGKTLLTASGDRTAKLTDVHSDTIIDIIPHQSSVNAVSLSHDGKHMLTAQIDGLIRLWRRPESTTVVTEFDKCRGMPGTRIALAPDGTRFVPYRWVSSPNPRTYGVFSSKSGNILEMKTTSVNPLIAAVFSPDGRYVLTSSSAQSGSSPGHLTTRTSQHGVIRIWDHQNGTEACEPIDTESEPIDAVFISNDECAVVCSDGQLLRVNIFGALTHIATVKGRPNLRHSGQSLRWLPSKGLLAVSAFDGVQVYDSSGTLIRHVAVGSMCNMACFSPNGQFLCAVGLHNGIAKIWDCQSWNRLALLKHSDRLYKVRFQRDGTRLVTTCRDHAAYIWDWRRGKILVSVHAAQSIADACFVADESLLATGSMDGIVRFWDSRTGLPVSPEYQLPARVHQIEPLHPDKVIVAGPGVYVIDVPRMSSVDNDSHLTTLWELASGKKLSDPSSVQLHNLTSARWLDIWRNWKQEDQKSRIISE